MTDYLEFIRQQTATIEKSNANFESLHAVCETQRQVIATCRATIESQSIAIGALQNIVAERETTIMQLLGQLEKFTSKPTVQ